MSVYRIAGLRVGIEPRYGQLKARCEKYQDEDQSGTVNMLIAVSDEQIFEFLRRAPNLNTEECEYLLAGADFYGGLIYFNGMLLHASAVALDGKAYLFSAPCGTGKSTHTALWQQYFGTDKAIIINDDKPAIRIMNGRALVYGTPFSGKYDLSANAAFELGGICFLHQSSKNEIEELSEKKAIYSLLNQSIRPSEMERMKMLLKTIESLLGLTRVYTMGCDISFDAVKLSYETMKKGLTAE